MRRPWRRKKRRAVEFPPEVQYLIDRGIRPTWYCGPLHYPPTVAEGERIMADLRRARAERDRA